jgi:poly(hydroxyalkanoate) granule-associated protein
MAARKKKGRAGSGPRRTRAKAKASKAPANVVESVQQVWLAGMGAIARAQKEGPAAFQDAVADGFKLLTRSRSSAEKMIRDVFESAQGSVQSRLDSARGQATETWDNLEVLFQSRVQRALQQIGVPTAEEIRLLTRRVAELNDNVKSLAARPARRTRTPATAKRRAARPKAKARPKVKRGSR